MAALAGGHAGATGGPSGGRGGWGGGGHPLTDRPGSGAARSFGAWPVMEGGRAGRGGLYRRSLPQRAAAGALPHAGGIRGRESLLAAEVRSGGRRPAGGVPGGGPPPGPDGTGRRSGRCATKVNLIAGRG